MEQFIDSQWIAWAIVIVGLWTLPWKGIALWKSARQNEKWWFIVLLVVNTVGLLEILYIFVFSKKKELKDQKAE
jgi:hypothetical protein